MGNKSHSEKTEKNAALCVFRLGFRLRNGEKRKNPNVICRGAFCSAYELFTVVFGSLIEAPVDLEVIKGEERDFIFLSFFGNHSTTARRCVLGSRGTAGQPPTLKGKWRPLNFTRNDFLLPPF